MRRTIVLLTTMALTLLVGSGVALAAGIGSAGAQSSVPGNINGFSTQMWYLPEKDATVVVNVNRYDSYSEVPAEAILGDIVEILFPKYVPS